MGFRDLFGRPRIRCTPDREDKTMTCAIIRKTKDGEETEAIVKAVVTDIGIEFIGEDGPQQSTDLLKQHINNSIKIKKQTGEF